MKGNLQVLLLLGIMFLVACTPLSLNAATYYVSPTGNDLNLGSIANPWKTIQKAANTMVAGDTVYIRAGAYAERVIPQNSGTAGNYITYAAYPGETATIDGATVTLPTWDAGLFEINTKDYIKISGLRIINAGPNQNNAGILVDLSSYIIIEKNYTYNTVSSGIGVWGSNNVIIDNNEVELACNDGEQECITIAGTSFFEARNNLVHNGGPGSMGGEGIDVKDGSSNGKIFKNYVHHLPNKLGIYVEAWDKHTFNIEVYQNLVHDVVNSDGIALASEMGGLLENIKIYNNIVYNAEFNGIGLGRDGPVTSHPMKNIMILNNTLYNNGSAAWGGGISVDNPDVQNVIIRNNIFSQNYMYQIEVEPDVPMGQLVIDYNLIDGYRGYTDEVRGTNFVEANPLFVNTITADFHLQAGSPAIDNGSSINAPTTDFDGNPRPRGSGYDMGAYEYAKTVPVNKITLVMLIILGGLIMALELVK